VAASRSSLRFSLAAALSSFGASSAPPSLPFLAFFPAGFSSSFVGSANG